jgi:hypothetical protein
MKDILDATLVFRLYYVPEMSIAVENLPLPHRRGLKNLTPRRCRATVL